MAIWNSWMASWGRFCKGPPTTSSLLSAPSRVTLPPRPSWPAEETTTELVFVGSKFGAGELPGTRNDSSMKLRPFRGRRSMAFEAEDALHDRRDALDREGFRRHVDPLAEGRRFELHRHLGVLSHLEGERRVLLRGEGAGLTRRTYEPGAEVGEHEAAPGVGRGLALHAGGGGAQRHAGAGHGGSLRVRDPAAQGGGGLGRQRGGATSTSDSVVVVSFMRSSLLWALGSAGDQTRLSTIVPAP